MPPDTVAGVKTQFAPTLHAYCACPDSESDALTVSVKVAVAVAPAASVMVAMKFDVGMPTAGAPTMAPLELNDIPTGKGGDTVN